MMVLESVHLREVRLTGELFSIELTFKIRSYINNVVEKTRFKEASD